MCKQLEIWQQSIKNGCQYDVTNWLTSRSSKPYLRPEIPFIHVIRRSFWPGNASEIFFLLFSDNLDIFRGSPEPKIEIKYKLSRN